MTDGKAAGAAGEYEYNAEFVDVEFEDGIAFVSFNRPEKRNAMSPQLNAEMLETLEALELDERCKVLVLTGKGDAWSAGMDLKEYFREQEGKALNHTLRTRMTAFRWQRSKLMHYLKPTIAMVNGWCFGGAFVPLVSCDLAFAAEGAQFGLSEINWGIIPGGNVTRCVAAKMNQADCLYYIMTGETFDGVKAKEMGLINEVLPSDALKDRNCSPGWRAASQARAKLPWMRSRIASSGACPLSRAVPVTDLYPA
jgi:trans-feruloyl-CoA hydratase/vanillin synthase